MMRAIVVDSNTGAILRQVTGSPAMLGMQGGFGESVFALVDDDGGYIDDGQLLISENGQWEAKATAPEGLPLPASSLEFVSP
jgi:hypothetical protein